MVKLSSLSQSNYAGFGRRLLAYGVDFLILFLVSLLIQAVLGGQASLFPQTVADIKKGGGLTPQIVKIVIAGLMYVISWVHFDGATPGKKLMAIKIVKTDGSPVTYVSSIVRYVSTFLSGFVFMMGYFWVVWDKKKQSWHDKIAGTVVIKTDKQPKTMLAVFLTFVVIIAFSAYFFATVYKAIMIGVKKEGMNTSDVAQLLITTNKARTHYEESQKLFLEMRAAEKNGHDIQALGNQTISEAQMAVDAEPSNALLWANLGDAYSWPNTVGGSEEMLEAYQKAQELEPENTNYINSVGDTYIRLKQYDEAVIELKKGLRLQPDSALLHLTIGKAYVGLNILDEAESHLQKAIILYKENNSDGKYDEDILDAQKHLGYIH